MALTLKQALAMFWEQIQIHFVKRENGKGLSTNDFTTEEKNKLASLENTTVDTTLTIEGAAADAKVVGEALAGKQPIGEYALKDDIVQPDWNQNDENAPDYVKNRTHWEEELEPIVIFEEQEVELVTDRYVASSNHLGFVLKPNTKYRVIFDGKEYEGVSYYENEYKDTIYLFNELYNNDNPDDVFCITTFLHTESGEEPTTYLEVRDENAGIYTFALYELTTNVHQLDPKFIPTASEEQLIQLLMDIDALPAMTDSNGAIFTHKDSILLI